MKLSEVKKFYDGTLMKICHNLIHMVNTNELGKGNRRWKGIDWAKKDVKKSNEMVDKIDKTLKHKEQLRRLEEYVGVCWSMLEEDTRNQTRLLIPVLLEEDTETTKKN
ncbi:hypothetical protein Tco_1086085 [Tanacetum coccineum]